MKTFVHIPKTGGHAIMRAAKLSGVPLRVIHHNARLPDYKQRHGIVAFRRDRPDSPVFTVVRNPYDRLVSAYYYLLRGGINPMDEADAAATVERSSGLQEFVLNGELEKAAGWQIHFLPQTYWICQGNRFLVNDIYRFEALEKVINREFRGVEVPILNQTAHPDWRHLLSTEAQMQVYRIYRFDFKMLEYDGVVAHSPSK